MCLKTLSRHCFLGGLQGHPWFIWKADGNLLVSEEDWMGQRGNGQECFLVTVSMHQQQEVKPRNAIWNSLCFLWAGTGYSEECHSYSFSTFLCVYETKRKNESENEKKWKYPGMWFPQYHSTLCVREAAIYLCHQPGCILEGLPLFHRDRNHTY